MDEPQRYATTKFRDSHIPGEYCSSFLALCKKTDRDLGISLSSVLDTRGKHCGIMFNLQSPHPSDNIYMEVFVLEDKRKVEINFCGFKREFSDPGESLDFIEQVRKDDIVIMSRYVMRRLDSESLEEMEKAQLILAELRNSPTGCLNYLLPRKLERIWIRTWSGSKNTNAHNY